MAEFWRALGTLKALQAEQATGTGPALAAHRLQVHPLEAHPMTPAAPPPLVHRPQPNEPERGAGRRLQNVLAEPPPPGRTLHEPTAQTQPNEPERASPRRLAYLPSEPDAPDRTLHEAAALWLPKEPGTGHAACAGVREAATGQLA
jgi:hypothetical protein